MIRAARLVPRVLVQANSTRVCGRSHHCAAASAAAAFATSRSAGQTLPGALVSCIAPSPYRQVLHRRLLYTVVRAPASDKAAAGVTDTTIQSEQQPTAAATEENTEGADGPLDRLARGLGWATGFFGRKQVLKRSAQTIYDRCTEPALRPELYRLCGLEDTFQSWFLVVHLHMWMVMCRLKGEGRDGAVVYQQMVELFWHDSDHRMKMMGVNDSSVVKESTRELVDMFYGLTFAYDEGITSDDVVLASALWRNLFGKRRYDPAAVERLVEYVRREVYNLDAADSDLLLEKGELAWGALPQEPYPASKESPALNEK